MAGLKIPKYGGKDAWIVYKSSRNFFRSPWVLLAAKPLAHQNRVLTQRNVITVLKTTSTIIVRRWMPRRDIVTTETPGCLWKWVENG